MFTWLRMLANNGISQLSYSGCVCVCGGDLGAEDGVRKLLNVTPK